MAQIYIKGKKDPLYIPDVKARVIEKLKRDGKDDMGNEVERDAFIDLDGKWGGALSEIRSVDFSTETSASDRAANNHWIIIRDSKPPKAWKKSFPTLQEAEAEMQFHDLAHSGYKIEECGFIENTYQDTSIYEMEELEAIKKDLRHRWPTKREKEEAFTNLHDERASQDD